MRVTIPEPSRRLTLQQVLHLATINSLDVRVAGYQPGIDANRVIGGRRPISTSTYYAKFQYQNQSVVNPRAFPSRRSTRCWSSSWASRRPRWRPALSRRCRTGPRPSCLTRARGPTRVCRRGQINPSQPFYSSELAALQITQPLLNGFGYDINQASILIARDTQRVSLLDARLALEKNLADIEQAYWQLVLAEQTVEIQEAAPCWSGRGERRRCCSSGAGKIPATWKSPRPIRGWRPAGRRWRGPRRRSRGCPTRSRAWSTIQCSRPRRRS